MESPSGVPAQSIPIDFIREIVSADRDSGKHEGRVLTRFPPEPNGYLHIGHAKAICLNFGIAAEFGGHCNLRFDDTNPTKEDVEYISAIKADIQWLGFDSNLQVFFASDYFERMFTVAEQLVRDGHAYVDSLSAEEIRAHRGALTTPGINSPYRDRSVADNLELFQRMRNGEFSDGAHVLRAKIDMASPNINMRDPTLYRIRHAVHHRTGTMWCIYPTYDYAHPLSDVFEGITHSLCTLEFEAHRPLYNWVTKHSGVPSRPQQIEFARLNLNYTVVSKRRLLSLVEQKHVAGWDDPRMPTLAAMRRRGYPPEAIRDFVTRVGVTKKENIIDLALLEHCVRENLNYRAPRALAVLRPLKVVIATYPGNKVEHVTANNNPQDSSAGTREVPFTREIYIEQEDFMENPPKKFFRLSPGQEVRLRYAYIVRCEHVLKNSSGEIVELQCSHDPASHGEGSVHRRVKGTLHWVSAAHAVDAKVKLYNRLFRSEDPNPAGSDPVAELNSESCVLLEGCKLEPMLADVKAGSCFQFERQGYFTVDPDSRPGTPVFNRTVTLKDTWARMQKRNN
jgi:glutaminyl-tRNA synthetase